MGMNEYLLLFSLVQFLCNGDEEEYGWRRICILMSTFTYSYDKIVRILLYMIRCDLAMDAIWLLLPYLVVICSHINHARSGFQPSWFDRMKDWNDYPQCGSVLRITFAVIVDIMHHTGICFAYHLGPLFYLGHDVWRLTLPRGSWTTQRWSGCK